MVSFDLTFYLSKSSDQYYATNKLMHVINISEGSLRCFDMNTSKFSNMKVLLMLKFHRTESCPRFFSVSFVVNSLSGQTNFSTHQVSWIELSVTRDCCTGGVHSQSAQNKNEELNN